MLGKTEFEPVEFRGIRNQVNDVEKLYHQADALILVSIYEALPAVIMEAMIEGCFGVYTPLLLFSRFKAQL